MIDWPKVVRDLEAENARLKKALAECRSIELQDTEQSCKTHPDAPHGFCRNASLSEDRYVCECEFWEPPHHQWVGLTAKDLSEIPASCFEGAIWADAKLKEKNT